MATILIIDDEEQIRKLMEKMLSWEGYDTLLAANGEEGLKLYNEKGADLIITDLIMPDKEGIETIMELKKIDPSVKIIAMSGGGKNDPETYLPLAKGLGALATLKKPFALDELLNIVRDLLELGDDDRK